MSALPDAAAWRGAAARRADLFEALDPGARIGLIERSAPVQILLWQVGDRGIEARTAPFQGYAGSGADLLLSADADALRHIAEALSGDLFQTLRADIRSGALVCYMLRKRCDLEARGFDELLDALGFVFMGACR